MWTLLDKSAHERRRQRMDLHSERLEAKLNAVDWAGAGCAGRDGIAARSSWI